MCTVSWLHTADGYELFCNRDERKARPQAFAPSVRLQCGVRFIAPLDALHAGSWLAVNQFGLTLSLLNRYDSSPAKPKNDMLSRGLLVRGLIACATREEVEERLSSWQLSFYQPFTLAIVNPQSPTRICHWDGKSLNIETAANTLLTSSSLDTQNVIREREAMFHQLKTSTTDLSPHQLRQFHHSHEPLALDRAVCMHRAESETVSFSHVLVTSTGIEFNYSPGSPCRVAAETSYAIKLDRVSHA
jgi:Transport and Golgi organisation 2